MRRVGATCSLNEVTRQIGGIDDNIRHKLISGVEAETFGSSSSNSSSHNSSSNTTGTERRMRTWWGELLRLLDTDDSFFTALHSNIEQGEAAYQK